MTRDIRIIVNGSEQTINADDDRPLLDVLREDLELTGTKYGCGEGECGACTVLIDGTAARSCITGVGEAAGRQIQTIEGLAGEGGMHTVQQAFLDCQAMQCGYCVPGQILSAAALLAEKPRATREEIVEAMSGNVCRCCNYENILAAVEQAAGGVR